MSTSEQSGRPGRYQRSAFGLIVALVTTVVAIGVVIWVMGLFRNTPTIHPDRVDYRSAVATAQEGGLRPVYPTALPEGWYATQAQVPDDGDGFEIDLLHGDKDFIGIRVARHSSVPGLVRQDVDEEATGADGYVVPDAVRRPVARHWQGFEDSGGDTAYAAELGKDGKEKVLVYGSASPDVLQQVVDALTRRPVRSEGQSSSSASPSSTASSR